MESSSSASNSFSSISDDDVDNNVRLLCRATKEANFGNNGVVSCAVHVPSKSTTSHRLRWDNPFREGWYLEVDANNGGVVEADNDAEDDDVTLSVVGDSSALMLDGCCCIVRRIVREDEDEGEGSGEGAAGAKREDCSRWEE